MAENLVARSTVTVNAPADRVWKALVSPPEIRRYMFGADVASDWKVGSPITWRGDWKGRPYEDKGEILAFEPEKRLEYTHYSPLTGKPDRPESYHRVSVELAPEGYRTHVALTQDNNPDEDARRHSERNWDLMLAGLKRWVEQHGGREIVG